MVHIAPSLLAADFGCLNEEIALVHAAGADWLHLDVMDGHYVPNLTLGPPVLARLDKPQGLVMDAHLMVSDPDSLVADFARAGCQRLTIQAEAPLHLHRSIALIRDHGMKPGVALNPATPLSAIEWVLDDVDLVLVMSVNPGFGGQTYIPQTTQKIAELSALVASRGLEVVIEVDGGIKPDTIGDAAREGATVFVAGSAVFGAKDYARAIAALREAAQIAQTVRAIQTAQTAVAKVA